MDAGRLDRRVTIQALTTSSDALGGVTETWADLATVWAQFLPGAGKEAYSAAAVHAEAQARFRIRWRSDVTTVHRVIYDGKAWDILAVDEIGRREGLELKVKAVQ
ncbi:hypothetical protein A6A04_13450 [Paramagnetospirillum marisnigri]|uniref:Head-tail adaptor protein n=1 Tax=Paramagnetospirillum marisnigri TaxID=1285242 RepID=A0A178MX51_9PROT|nr:phage head closure protein [Paramagnetospirillum marisnigri]OAN53892.1 hypothetical protein A6A04_13450 [Paramagnetospirillum marisnigri]